MTKEMTYLAKQIIPAMIEDGIVDNYINASESKRIEILDLYVEAWNKKSKKFKFS